MPQPLVWKAQWIRFSFAPKISMRQIHAFLTDIGPYELKEKQGSMNVRFCQPDVEDDFIKNGPRKARTEIGDGIVLDIQPVEDEKMKQAALVRDFLVNDLRDFLVAVENTNRPRSCFSDKS